ncbi:hypothetical protein BC938DRAFT_478130 [Jimgerdemannia flammicorona]|uniref:Uncharacterized protein n=1 Tax=Jimgerdemannia flammicorona TaxID=994334 RepID=A0A433P6J5_9FUNG|nr:hypothetical protein BC938DRAFT_478130 [Jimgerdemannia flammicorona]
MLHLYHLHPPHTAPFAIRFRLSYLYHNSTRELGPAKALHPEAIIEDDSIIKDISTGTLIYQFPLSSIHLIPEFVKWLESKTSGVEIVNTWGISQMTLKEVFLKLIRYVGLAANHELMSFPKHAKKSN